MEVLQFASPLAQVMVRACNCWELESNKPLRSPVPSPSYVVPATFSATRRWRKQGLLSAGLFSALVQNARKRPRTSNS